ncbi:hypothetical protein DQ239_16935 [Blastococcus sp. TF02-09]|uniref:hypothetical protein n=1 Tax=Blastococcus sp. TF02-09 TaxID=2250576 RepID=UPI000DEAFACC|nr:hypothetical protein [Blastococcus sp. TF02-9]RBY75360.1 hypothetical protein DQ239_16935 [Blastococcus sp. TF02-9]
MNRRRLAQVHRSIGRAEHGVEERMLAQAPRLPDSEEVRDRARAISANAERHLAAAARLDGTSDPDEATDHDAWHTDRPGGRPSS